MDNSWHYSLFKGPCSKDFSQLVIWVPKVTHILSFIFQFFQVFSIFFDFLLVFFVFFIPFFYYFSLVFVFLFFYSFQEQIPIISGEWIFLLLSPIFFYLLLIFSIIFLVVLPIEQLCHIPSYIIKQQVS